MEIDIQKILQKVQAKLGELMLQNILQEVRAEAAEAEKEKEGADHDPD
jgi:hypothetical protein